MTNYLNQFATQRGFGANLIKVPQDKADKIRKRGLQSLRYQEEDLKMINRQADRVISQFESNNRVEKEARESNFKLKQEYANTLAEARWRNFETKIKQNELDSRRPDPLQQLLSITQKGQQLYGQIESNRRKDIDLYADTLYRDYDIGAAAAERIRNAKKTGRLDELLKEDAASNAVQNELGLKPDIPLEIIERVGSGSGYLRVAIQNQAARRHVRNLKLTLPQHFNDEDVIPGLKPGQTYNNTQDPKVKELILNQLISNENLDTNGNKIFSNNTFHLIGAHGPDGTINSIKASFIGASDEARRQRSYNDRHKPVLYRVKEFIDQPQKYDGQGFQEAVWHMAGGQFVGDPNVSSEALAIGRHKVTESVIWGLKNQELTWGEVEQWGEAPVKQRGSNKTKKWKDQFRDEWLDIKKAGKDAVTLASKDYELRLGAKKEELYDDMEGFEKSQIYDIETLTTLYRRTLEKGEVYAPLAQKILARMDKMRTTSNDKVVEARVKHLINTNQIVTDELLNGLSLGAQARLRSLADSNNANLPSGGGRDDDERIEDYVDALLHRKIGTGLTGKESPTHDDAVRLAKDIASGYYKNIMISSGDPAKAYDDAKSLITDYIETNSDFEVIDNLDGTRSFRGVSPDRDLKAKDVLVDFGQWGIELSDNPDLIFSKRYVSNIESFSAKVNRGVNIEIPQSAMMIQSLTRGKISAIDVMVAQNELARNEEIKRKGSTNIQPLRKDYIQLYRNEENKIHPNLRSLLGPEIHKTTQAYVGSNYLPPNTRHIYDKIAPIVSVGSPNAIAGDDLKLKDSTEELGYNITDITIRESLRLMENGKFSSVGTGQWDYDRLLKASELANISLDTRLSDNIQRRLLNTTIKNSGIEGFPHANISEEDRSTFNESLLHLNKEKVEDVEQAIGIGYWRSKLVVNSDAWNYLKTLQDFKYEMKGHPMITEEVNYGE